MRWWSVAVVLLAAAGPAGGTESHTHAGHGAAPPATEAVRAFLEANDRMHRDMAIAFTGDADTDFARGMIPHHQGAIDMARVVLAHGTDPEIRRLAEAIVAAQESEIAFLRDWLARRER